MKNRRIIVSIVALFLCLVAGAQRYCNPLPMPVGSKGNAGGDVSIFFDEGKYYMYCSGGGAWVSEDLLNWEYYPVDNIPIAPDVHKYNGKYYLTGNDITIWEGDTPLGPFHDLGPFKNTGGPELGWKVPFDSMLFVDDDNTPYLFWPGRGRTGIYGVELDKNDLTRFVSAPTHLFSYNPLHWFEHMGEHNEYQNVAWIEGPWVIKRNGIYYCAYSCSGTEWKSYAAGYYTATSPLGPYTYGGNNPLLRKTDGVVTGPSRGCMIKGPDGEYWAFYTIVLGGQFGGRKIGMDKIEFDELGNMSIKVTETPQPAPLGKPETGRKSVQLSMNKSSRGSFSSEQPGFFASYAVDEFAGTCWRPKPDDKQPYLMLDLSPAVDINVIDLFDVDGLRILFAGGGRGSLASLGSPNRERVLPVYKYKLEGSMDGKNFYMLLDKTNNTKSADTIYEDVQPRQCRYIKLTITDWPKETELGIIEATVFGKYSGYINPTNPQENDRYLYNY